MKRLFRQAMAVSILALALTCTAAAGELGTGGRPFAMPQKTGESRPVATPKYSYTDLAMNLLRSLLPLF